MPTREPIEKCPNCGHGADAHYFDMELDTCGVEACDCPGWNAPQPTAQAGEAAVCPTCTSGKRSVCYMLNDEVHNTHCPDPWHTCKVPAPPQAGEAYLCPKCNYPMGIHHGRNAAGNLRCPTEPPAPSEAERRFAKALNAAQQPGGSLNPAPPAAKAPREHMCDRMVMCAESFRTPDRLAEHIAKDHPPTPAGDDMIDGYKEYPKQMALLQKHFWCLVGDGPLVHVCDEASPQLPTPELLAQQFHEAYERLAPQFSYKTREASAKPWSEVPEDNKRLMIAVCDEILALQAKAAAPMGVSQWREYGKKYGYWKFFENEAAKPEWRGDSGRQQAISEWTKRWYEGGAK